MKFKNKISSAYNILLCSLFDLRKPVAVRWQLTNRCTARCSYCNLWKIKSSELSKEKIVSIIDEISKMGTQRISFSGGEPLLRKDIGAILDYCKKKGISTSMNSNGDLVKKRIDDIESLDLLKLSLDGPRKIHDKTRGKGSFDRVMDAARVAKKQGIRFTFATTITKHNINHLKHILDIARKYNTVVAFQPLKPLYKGIKDIKPIAPNIDDYHNAIGMLIREKRKGNKNIRNSLMALKHIYNWPRYKSLRCTAGKIFCMINVNGDVMPCDRISYDSNIPNINDMSFKSAFRKMPKVKCSGCGFCGALELNYLHSFKFDVLNDIRRKII